MNASQRRYLLDTNILSDLVRRPQGKVAMRIAAVGETAVCTSIVVACELRFGAWKSGSERLKNQVDTILSAIEILPFEPPVDAFYAEIRSNLQRSGTPIGPNDMLIAAHVLANRMTLVTANVREFQRVQSLSVENWLANEQGRRPAQV